MPKPKTPKPPKSRPISTADLNQPLLPSSGVVAASTASCSFSPSPDHGLFAHCSNHVHQQRLKIYNASATTSDHNSVVTDYLLQQPADVSCLSLEWVRVTTLSSSSPSKTSKRRKHTDSDAAKPNANADANNDTAASQLLLALGLSSGQIHLLSPSLAQAVAILDASTASGSSGGSLAAANSGVVSISVSESSDTLYACSKNGWVSVFPLKHIKLGSDSTPIKPVGSFRPDSKTAVHSISALGNHVLAAHHSITLVDSSANNKVKASFTGHASPVTHLEWLNQDTFVSAAEGDRVIYAWTYEATSNGKIAQGKPVATAALDAPVRCFAVSRVPTFASSESLEKDQQRLLLLVITQSGSIRIYALPEATAPNSTPGKKAKGSVLPALELVGQSSATTTSTEVEWLDGRFVKSSSNVNKIRLARLIRGAKVTIDDISIVDSQSGNIRKTFDLPTSSSAKLLSSDGGLLTADDDDVQLTGGSTKAQRYTDAPSRPTDTADAEMASLKEAGLLDSSVSRVNGGASDEPTLAQRLNSLGLAAENDNEQDDQEIGRQNKTNGLMNEASLSTSLTQALHSGDSALLANCLNHYDAGLIRATARRISGPLAVKLLEECVSRLNGVGGSHVSRGTMGSQRARGLIEWIRATLLNHMGYLMSLPHLVGKMSSLHATLTCRIATHERLLSLNGRLELVLSQIEARAAYMEQAAARGKNVQVQGVKLKPSKGDRSAVSSVNEKARLEGKKWVEESDDDDQDDMEVDQQGIIVRGEDDEDDDDQIQDIALGVEDDEDEDGDDDEIIVRRRRRVNGGQQDANTSAESDLDDEMDEDDEEDESDLEEEGASDLEDQEDEEEYDEEEAHGPNGMFDLEAEEGSDEEEE